MASGISKKRSILAEVFSVLFKNWKLFLPVFLISVALNLVVMGACEDAVNIVGALNFIFVWLITMFFCRYLMAGKKVKFRDGLYNAMTPFISALVVMAVAALQSLPLIILVVAWAAAVETSFLATFGYFIMFMIFAVAMVLISAYLLPSTIMAMAAVSAPGMYPAEALTETGKLMKGKRANFVFRILLVLLVLVGIWAIVLTPVVLIEMGIRGFVWTGVLTAAPVVAIPLTSFSGIFMSIYIYLYYRRLIDAPEKKTKEKK